MFAVDVFEDFAAKLSSAIELIKQAEAAKKDHEDKLRLIEVVDSDLNTSIRVFQSQSELVKAEKAKLAKVKNELKKQQAELAAIKARKETIITEFIETEKVRILAGTADAIKERSEAIIRETKMYSDAYDCLLGKYKQARGY